MKEKTNDKTDEEITEKIEENDSQEIEKNQEDNITNEKKENKSGNFSYLYFVAVLVFIEAILIGYSQYLNNNLNSMNIQTSVEVAEEKINYYEEGFNYLTIGNSITKHEINDVWFTESGMAATTPDKDYFHLVSTHLKDKYGKGNFKAHNFKRWEVTPESRTDLLHSLDEVLDRDLNLVTIQLGENFDDIENYKEKSIELINYVKVSCPKAQIIWVDNFFFKDKSDIDKEIVEECNIELADLSEIRNNEDYSTEYGTPVYDDLGLSHLITDYGVMTHPNDIAMKYIADKIIELIKE